MPESNGIALVDGGQANLPSTDHDYTRSRLKTNCAETSMHVCQAALDAVVVKMSGVVVDSQQMQDCGVKCTVVRFRGLYV